MDDIRKGQIALLLIKRKLRKDGIRLTPNFRREIGNEAKTTGVPFDELMEFIEIMVREQVEEAFAKTNRG